MYSDDPKTVGMLHYQIPKKKNATIRKRRTK